MKPKLLIIGLDGGTFTLIRPWTDKGLLPNLKRLIDEGTSGVLQSSILPITAPAWASLMTGVNPGKHGLYDFSAREKNGYHTVPINGSYRKARAFWDYLAEDGIRVGVVNVPGTYPPEPIHGFMVSGMLTPNTDVQFTYPAILSDELRQMDYRILFHEVYSGNNEDDVLDDVFQTALKRREVLLHLIQSKSWDIFFTVLPETDNLAHFFWGFMDTNHPFHDAKKGPKFGDVLQKVYQQADDTLGQLLSCVDDETIVMVMSDHGSGPLYKNLFLNNYLIQHGLMKLKSDLHTRVKTGFTQAGFTVIAAHELLTKLGLTKRFRHLIGYSEKKSFIKNLLNIFLTFTDVDWSQTRAYSMGNYGQVFVNLCGREPGGIVQPGREYEELREEIIGLLKDLKDPETEQPIIDRIFKREEIYKGPYVENAPDIVFIPTEMKYMTSRFLEFASSKIVEPEARHRTGGHTMEGIFILRGQGIRRHFTIEGVRLIDVAPTILHMFGAPIPSEMDGRAIVDLFETNSKWMTNPPRIMDISIQRNVWQSSPHEDDQEIIKERLRGLGYMA